MGKLYAANEFRQACFSPGGKAAEELKNFLAARSTPAGGLTGNRGLFSRGGCEPPTPASQDSHWD
jgi:hypothetical protein